jgi:hypothetical protein
VARTRRRPALIWRRAAAAAAALALACAGSPGGELARRFPEAAGRDGHRLGDVHPYVLPAASHVTLFLCRWTTEQPIPVSLPVDATPEERRVLVAALEAWQGAGLGVRFVPIDGGEAPIRIELEGAPIQTGAGRDTGNAVVDCRVAPLSAQGRGDAVVGAELVAARIRLARRTGPDWQGRERDVTPAELAGAALHELGHALGFQGHVRQGDTVMVRELERIVRRGAALLEGERHGDATLRALYALPNGAVVTRVPVEAWRTDRVDRMAALAESAGLDGPFARVGETAARVFWRDPKGQEYGLVVPKLREVLRRPASVLVIPEARTRRALPRGDDLGPG